MKIDYLTGSEYYWQRGHQGTLADPPQIKGGTVIPNVGLNTVDELLATRDSSHGKYEDTAHIAQEFKSVAHAYWGAYHDRRLNNMQREAIDMICTKMGRIVAGDNNFKDHWIDIAGYAKLCADRCK